MRLPAAVLLSAAAFVATAAGPASYGESFEDGPAVPVSEAVANFDEMAGHPMRVKFGDHAFFLPKDQTGTAVVHGVLERKELTSEQVEHFTEDSGTGLVAEPVEYRILADGVRVGA